MSFKIEHDFFDHPIIPPYILCKSNKERIGVLPCTAKTITVKFNAIDEISFTAHLYSDGRKNRYYDEIEVMKYILLPEIGFFSIDSVQIRSEGTTLEHKEVTAKSYECLLGQKYLDTFTVNMGTAESIDGVSFYNMADPGKSLLHLALEKCPDWTVGHVDTALKNLQRSFEVTKQDVYSFLTSDVSEAFACIFSFDTRNNTVNVYQEKNAGHDTDLYVSYHNLLKSTNITCNSSDIKTCLTLTGEDDLTIREINMGYDKIYNLSYFNSTQFMSQSLYDAYNNWLKKREDMVETYTDLLSQYQSYYTQIHYLEHLKMPDDPDSTDWLEYGLEPLKEKRKSYEQIQDTMMKAGWGDPEHKNYKAYSENHNIISEITRQINRVNAMLQFLKRLQSDLHDQMLDIIASVSIDNNDNFTLEQRKELAAFLREDELSAGNFVVTDIMTDEERFSMLHEFLSYGENELAKAAVPQMSFDADMVNLFAIPEFKQFHGAFDVGNYIHISMRDDFLVKARLLSMTVDFYDPANFNVTFGNIARTGSRMLDVTDAIALSQSAAASVSFHASRWNQAEKDASDIVNVLNEGLLGAGKSLTSGEDSEMIIDSRGIFVNTVSGDYAGLDSIFIGGGKVLFTDDNWQTVSMSVGRADVAIKGEEESRFGTFADFVIAGYISGSTLEGDEIYGGTIQSKNYEAGKFGTIIDLDEGTFEFCAKGERLLALDTNGDLTIKGTIHNGFIGGEDGFIVEDRKLYAGKNTFTSKEDGVYIGADGISLGADNTFQIESNGTLLALKGRIGGAVIARDSLSSENRNWQISSDGTASFQDVYVSGVQNGSSFGSIGYRDGVTYGAFRGNSSFESTLDAPLRGTCVSQIERIAAGQLTADLVKTKGLEAGFLTAETIKADFMEAADWTSAGCIKSDRIASCSIGADKLNVNDSPASWVPLTVVTGVTPIKDENGTVIDIAVSTEKIWFPGKKE